MNETVFTTEDKSTWGDGPWQNEPDKIVWIDPDTGLDCMAKRGRLGSWCGYVGVGPDHPLHGSEYDEVDVDVHGGLTYADSCFGDEATGICHTPLPGRPHDVWWFGFDCGHAFDWSPGLQARLAETYRERGELLPDCFRRLDDETYRDVAYVKSEVLRLAKQLANA